VWEPDLCVHAASAASSATFGDPGEILRCRPPGRRPAGFKSAPINVRGYPDVRFTLQFWIEDCTGLRAVHRSMSALSPVAPDTKAINLRDKLPLLESEKRNIEFFQTLPMNDRARVDFANVRGVQYLEPLFEFSGACAGCGETRT